MLAHSVHDRADGHRRGGPLLLVADAGVSSYLTGCLEILRIRDRFLAARGTDARRCRCPARLPRRDHRRRHAADRPGRARGDGHRVTPRMSTVTPSWTGWPSASGTRLLDADPTQGTAIGEHRYGDRLSDISAGGPGGTDRPLRGDSGMRRRLQTDAADPEAGADAGRAAPVDRGTLAILRADARAYTVDAMRPADRDPLGHPLLPAPARPGRRARHAGPLVGDGPWVDGRSRPAAPRPGRGARPVAGSVQRVIAQLDDVLARPTQEGRCWRRSQRRDAGWTDADGRRSPSSWRGGRPRGARPAIVRFRTFLADESPRARARTRPRRDRAAARRGGDVSVPGASAHDDRPGRRRRSTPSACRDRADRRGDRASWAAACWGRATCPRRWPRCAGTRSSTSRAAEEIVAVAKRLWRRAEAAMPGLVRPAAHAPLRGGAHAGARGGALDHRLLPRAGARRQPAGPLLHQHLRSRRRGRATRRRRSPSTRRSRATTCRSRSRRSCTGLPAFRRHAETTAYVEGWGLYAERLADEMGLYSGDLDRIGMLCFDAWRACAAGGRHRHARARLVAPRRRSTS